MINTNMEDEYYTNRAEEIIKDKPLIKLLYLIGKENKLSIETVNKDKNKKYFKQMVIDYLKHDENQTNI